MVKDGPNSKVPVKKCGKPGATATDLREVVVVCDGPLGTSLTFLGGKDTGLVMIEPGIPTLLLRRLPQVLSNDRRNLSMTHSTTAHRGIRGTNGTAGRERNIADNGRGKKQAEQDPAWQQGLAALEHYRQERPHVCRGKEGPNSTHQAASVKQGCDPTACKG